MLRIGNIYRTCRQVHFYRNSRWQQPVSRIEKNRYNCHVKIKISEELKMATAANLNKLTYRAEQPANVEMHISYSFAFSWLRYCTQNRLIQFLLPNNISTCERINKKWGKNQKRWGFPLSKDKLCCEILLIIKLQQQSIIFTKRENIFESICIIPIFTPILLRLRSYFKQLRWRDGCIDLWCSGGRQQTTQSTIITYQLEVGLIGEELVYEQAPRRRGYYCYKVY